MQSISMGSILIMIFSIAVLSVNIIATSSRITTTYTISLSSSCITAGGAISTDWNITGGVSLKNADWIGIYQSGRCGKTVGSSCPSGSDAWRYVSTNGTSGTVIISAPTTTGTYQAYYLYNNSHTIKAISPLFSISSSCSKVNLTVNPETAVINQSVIISWSGANTNDINDWIAFWQIDSSPSTDDNHISNSWAYTYGGTVATDAHPTASGNVSIPVPSLYGIYTIYYCQNNGYTCPSSITVKVVNPNMCQPSGSTTSTVKHIIIVISENHSFDSIYGRYCTATTGSKPTCNLGPSCCEAAPNNIGGHFPKDLTDQQNLNYDPNHSSSCEMCEINNGSMNRYITGCSCSSVSNFAVADNTSATNYYSWASSYAIADNFFQSAAGASCENDMYFATGKFLFWDDDVLPQNPNLNGARCYSSNFKSYSSTTIADLLNYCGINWTFYAEGYDQNPSRGECYPNYYDASDDPFTYFPSLTNSSQSLQNFRDYNNLYSDITIGKLPSVSYVKGLGIHSEHPRISTITAGETISQNIINAISASNTYINNTVIFMIPDESGGYYDHVSPPPKSTIDNVAYGPRTQFIAVGYQIKQNYVSHVQMEPSSLIKFIEWNWLNGNPGQLGTRDTVVNNIGDMFDSTKTGVNIPSN